jgi:hypothetical protein
MKRCPKCNFSFADFHDVCDFDGTSLVDDPATLLVSPGVSALVAATQSPFLRLVKSPVFLIVLGLAGVLSSLLLMVYYDAANQANPIVANQPSQNSIVNPVVPKQTSVQPVQIPPATLSGSSKRTEKSSSTARRPATATRSSARLHSSMSARNQSGRSALQRESKDAANKKEPKLTAMLKTTWNILKRPFKF